MSKMSFPRIAAVGTKKHILYTVFLWRDEGLPCFDLVDIDCRLWVYSLVYGARGQDFSYLYTGVTKQKNSLMCSKEINKKTSKQWSSAILSCFLNFLDSKFCSSKFTPYETHLQKLWLAVKPALRWGCRKVNKYDLLVLTVLWCTVYIVIQPRMGENTNLNNYFAIVSTNGRMKPPSWQWGWSKL